MGNTRIPVWTLISFLQQGATDEALVQAADTLFIELDKSEARDADSNALKEGIVLYERG